MNNIVQTIVKKPSTKERRNLYKRDRYIKPEVVLIITRCYGPHGC